jgi:hypothetical protein
MITLLCKYPGPDGDPIEIRFDGKTVQYSELPLAIANLLNKFMTTERMFYWEKTDLIDTYYTEMQLPTASDSHFKVAATELYSETNIWLLGIKEE